MTAVYKTIDFICFGDLSASCRLQFRNRVLPREKPFKTYSQETCDVHFREKNCSNEVLYKII